MPGRSPLGDAETVFQRMVRVDFDLVVIGGGPGGIAAARRAAIHGARVGLAEAGRLGGTCVNRGCVPKKLMVYGARFADQWPVAAAYGWRLGKPEFHWSTLGEAIDREVVRLNGVYRDALDQAGVTLFRHRAHFVDPHTLALGSDQVTATTILIATGGRPQLPEIPGIEHAITSDDMFHLPQLPRRLVVIGGGYIGTEFACIMQAFGSAVTQIAHSEEILSGFDDDLRREVHRFMTQRGIQIITGGEATALAQADGSLSLTVATPNGDKTIEADGVCLAATGRQPNVQGLGLNQVGVELQRGAIAVDDQYRTTVPHIFAIGDVTGRVELTPVAIAEGRRFADAQFGQTTRPLDYDLIPSAVFTTPELGTVGLSEAAAIEQFGAEAIETHCSRFLPLYYSPTDLESKTLIKLVVERASDRVLGAHMVGDHAAEIVQSLAIALTQGVTKADFDATMAIHPTSAEEWVTLG
jgi:glutathione reductase (NADPH)